MTVDDERNVAAVPDCDITGDGRVRVLVVAAREDLEIASAVHKTLGRDSR